MSAQCMYNICCQKHIKIAKLTVRISPKNILSRNCRASQSKARFPIVCQSHKPCCGSFPTRLVVGNIATTSLVGIPATASTVGKPATTKLVGTCFTSSVGTLPQLCLWEHLPQQRLWEYQFSFYIYVEGTVYYR